MKIIIAMDSFKGSMTSLEAGEAAKAGVLDAVPDAEVTVRPLADGGEGTMESLRLATQAVPHEVTVTGPLGTPVTASYAVTPNGMAILDMASAAGLILVPEDRRDPMHTTTRGLGELILAAAGNGCRDFLIGIGGSATNDAGAGMLAALGVSLLDTAGNPIPDGANGLSQLAWIDRSTMDPALKDCRFRIICDVTNPLCGPNGASYIYGPQKGADPAMCADLDALLGRFAQLTETTSRPDSHSDAPQAEPSGAASLADTPGAGAAGGLGYAFLAYLEASLLPGIEIVLEETRLEDYLTGADLLITGEGRLDAQTANGKAPAGAAALAKKHGIPVIALAGMIRLCEEEAPQLHAAGIDEWYTITPPDMPHETAKQPAVAQANMRAAAAQAICSRIQ